MLISRMMMDGMLRTGAEYVESLRDGRQVWIDGEKVADVTAHPAFKPIVEIRARIYDLGHDEATRGVMTYCDDETGDTCAIGSKPPSTKADWERKRRAVDTVLDEARGVVTRVGDETVGEMWSLFDGQDVLNQINPAFGENIRRHVRRAALEDPFHVSANTDPKGDRSIWPQDQDPDVLLHVVGENDNGIIVRGAKFETAAAYAHQAFVKPTIAEWQSERHSEYAVGFRADMSAPGVKHICRSGFAARMPADYPLASRVDEVDTMIVFDDVLIPWEDVFFYRHVEAAAYIRATLHRYSIFPYVQRYLRWADFLLGFAYANAQQTGTKIHQGVREKIAEVAAYRAAINAFLVTAIEMAEPSPAGLLMPHQETIYAGRMFACSNLPQIVHTVRDLSGCQISLIPSAAQFADPETAPWLSKYFAVGPIEAEERRKLLAFGRDLVNSDYATHRLTFQLFAQSPPFSHRLALYNNYDFEPATSLVMDAAKLKTIDGT
jgi:4-hydroxyphenylacetate 3-monooxygenase